ncbi:MAG: aldehyde dehydrogenase (NADP(+)) [Pyrinomonadaceae bacterium]|nr:aldehyde dehydrogenase (NADP(+)) [Pyrinomonadaceae bacterium]
MNTGSQTSIKLEGVSLIGNGRGELSDRTFTAFNPRTGEAIAPDFHGASHTEVERAAGLANDASREFAATSNEERARFLRSIADHLEDSKSDIVDRASEESGLPPARFEGELGRAAGQIRMFANVVEEGSWVDARIDRAEPDREPLPKPDVRSLLTPLGPVAVFCASNFPIAFSVAGGDTASALAAGCPVVVIAHSAHPGTAELAGLAIRKAVEQANLPEGVFSLLFSDDYSAGQALVRDPNISAVGFTGSRKGGTALAEIASKRERPIPVFAEMSAVNPVFLLKDALEERIESIAEGLFGSFTLGFGQFCTKPGIVALPEASMDEFGELLGEQVKAAGPVPLLTRGIHDAFVSGVKKRGCEVSGNSANDDGFYAETSFARVSATDFLANPRLANEIFGPTALVVGYDSTEQLYEVAESFEGQLTATVHGTAAELRKHEALVGVLSEIAGRIVFNGFPTGVEVCGAMVHGGPFPATTDARTTSVGKRAIERFTKLTAFQGFPQESLPDALKDDNPLHINRIED